MKESITRQLLPCVHCILDIAWAMDSFSWTKDIRLGRRGNSLSWKEGLANYLHISAIQEKLIQFKFGLLYGYSNYFHLLG